MTLRDVPVEMAGSAGGALQTGQRFGAAIGTAALPGVFYAVLAATAGITRWRRSSPPRAGGRVAAVALAVAIIEWRTGVRRAEAGGAEPERIPDAA